MARKTETPLGKVQQTARKTANAATRQARSATRKAGDTVSDVRLKAGKAADEANRIITEHPLAAAAGAVILGAALAYLFPRSARAVRAAAPKVAGTLLTIAREAQQAARENLPVEQASELASRAGDAGRKVPHAIRESVSALPANVAHLGEQAAELAQRAGAEAGKAASRVREAALRAIK